MRWCFDTSALIEPWVRLYPPDVFPRVWEALDELVVGGRVIAPPDVRAEIERQNDGLADWIRVRSGMFLPVTRPLIERVTELVNDYPGFIKVNSTGSGADPFVVALAETEGVAVVTYESRAKKDQAPKIPNVCDGRGIDCVDLVHVLRAEGYSLK